MKQNIKNNHIRKIDSKLYNANYYDFMLSKNEVITYNKSYLDSLSIADFSNLNIKDNILYSESVWDKAINEGVELNNIGFTGVDNGIISFRKDRISNEKFLELFLNSKLEIESGDTRFFMTPITGNTLCYEYPIHLKEDNNEQYLSCQGGFYQGFFKLFGYKYQVLPDKLENDITLHFELRPRSDYNESNKTINKNHENNKGIFFFIGTRAENKFWPYYKTDSIIIKNFKKINATTEGYFFEDDSYLNKNNPVFNEWVKEESNNIEVNVGGDYFSLDGYLLQDSVLTINNNNYIVNELENNCPEFNNNKFVVDEYIGEDIKIDKDFKFTDSEGRAHNEHGINEIETDNKFIMFDRTPTGFTIDNWKEDTKLTLVSKKSLPKTNYFLLMNRTETGYTAHNIEEYNEQFAYEYSIYKDIRDNVFALRITDEGAIGYRYGIKDCESENKYKVQEEYSKNNIVKINEWNKINVRFKVINKDNMQILIYVNSNLVFISKILNSFNFKPLDDVAEKQESVPYNISLGGGSLGLMETIVPNYYAISNYILPIEKDFCGSFIGDIKSFKIYEGFIDYSLISNYLS